MAKPVLRCSKRHACIKHWNINTAEFMHAVYPTSFDVIRTVRCLFGCVLCSPDETSRLEPVHFLMCWHARIEERCVANLCHGVVGIFATRSSWVPYALASLATATPSIGRVICNNHRPYTYSQTHTRSLSGISRPIRAIARENTLVLSIIWKHLAQYRRGIRGEMIGGAHGLGGTPNRVSSAETYAGRGGPRFGSVRLCL